MNPDYSKIIALNEELEKTPKPPPYAMTYRGQPCLIAPTEEIAEAWREMYPGYLISVQQPLPTSGNGPHKKGRPDGL